MTKQRIAELVLPEWGWHYSDIESDQKLTLSLVQHGQLMPVLVYEDGEGQNVVLDGRRRVQCLHQLGQEDIWVSSLGRMTEEEAISKSLSLELRSAIDYVRVARTVKGLEVAGVNVHALASTTPWTAERMSYFLRLCNFNWADYAQLTHSSLFEEDEESVEGLEPLEDEPEPVEEAPLQAKEPRVPKAPKPQRTAQPAPQATISPQARLAHLLQFQHAPSAPQPVQDAGVPPKSAPKVAPTQVMVEAPALPSYLKFSGRERSVSTWTPDAPPSLDGIAEVDFDTEGTGVEWWKQDKPIGISIHYGGRRQYLPWGHAGGNLDEAVVKHWAERELRGKRLRGANIRYDVHMMRAWGIDLEAQGCTFTDVQHQAALLDEYRKEFNLEALMRDFLPHLRKTGQDLDKSRMAEYHAGEVAEYAEIDAEGVGQLHELFLPKLREQDLLRVYELENSVIPVVVEMEKNGAYIDRIRLRQWVKQAREMMNEYLWTLSRDLGFDMNPDKGDDWKRLFEKYDLPITAYTEHGAPSFTDDILSKIPHPMVQLARRAGKLASLKSKFLDAYNGVVADDCILRFALHQLRGDEYGTIRGRFSMSGGGKNQERFGANLQQVFSIDKQRDAFGLDPNDSSHDDEIFLIRSLFIPGDGNYLGADAQSIEYRLAAHYARSETLLKAYEADWKKLKDPSLQDGTWVDFHQVVQDIITPHKAVTRKTTKNLNFLKIYGGGRDKAAETLGLDRRESDQIVDLYDSMFPEFKELLKDSAQLARDRGFVRTILGRRARFPNKEFTHAALNYVIQGSAADIMKQKLVELHAERKDTGFVMRQTVHDEVDGDALSEETADKVRVILNRQSFNTKVPIIWKVKTGATWAQC